MKTASSPRRVKLRRLPHASDLPLPAYQSAGAAGLDLAAALGPGNTVTLAPSTHALVPTGLAIELPLGYEAQVRPRSGLAAKHAVTVLNSPGTIDADYRGEISVILINLGRDDFIIKHGDRIAQMVIASVTPVKLVETHALSETKRGSGAFGSTGGAGAASPKVRKTRNPISPKGGNKQPASSKPRSRKPR